MDYDAIITGAGPAGILAATKIAEEGHNVLLLEEHKKIGEPDHCAGLLSSSGLGSLNLKPPKGIIQNTVAGDFGVWNNDPNVIKRIENGIENLDLTDFSDKPLSLYNILNLERLEY